MSRIRLSSSAVPTDSAAGFVASIFRGTACMQKAFRQENGEFQYLEKCWSDAAVLHFILLGWIGLALKLLLFVLLATFLGACIQGRRPWYVFVSFAKAVGKVIGGLCSCFDLDDEVRERETAAEAGRGSGIGRQEEKGAGGYFCSPKQKVLSLSQKRNLSNVLTLMKM